MEGKAFYAATKSSQFHAHGCLGPKVSSFFVAKRFSKPQAFPEKQKWCFIEFWVKMTHLLKKKIGCKLYETYIQTISLVPSWSFVTVDPHFLLFLKHFADSMI